jgi:hypothetical protein
MAPATFADVITRRPTRVVARSAAVLPVVVLVVVGVIAAIALLGRSQNIPAASGDPTATVPAVIATASASSSAMPTSTVSATPRGQWANTRYGYTVVLPEPYHVSARLTREFPGSQHPAARDVFTVLSPAEEDAAMRGQDCEVGCAALNGAAVILIYTDAGSMTPRQWHEAGNTTGSPGKLTDVAIGGRPALKIEPSGKYNAMYVVADGQGRMFHLAYEFFHVAAAPSGATIAKVEEIFASVRFTT